MKHKESSFALTFRHYLHAHPMSTSTFELKDTRGREAFSMRELKPHQIDWALAIESDKGILMRTPAVSEGMPDYVYLRRVPAYVVIKYPSFFVVIPVEKLIKEKSKSLSAVRAKQLSII